MPPLARVLLACAVLSAAASAGGAPEEPKEPAMPKKPKPPDARLDVADFDDAVTLENDKVRLVVSPRVGRVISFGRKDGPNLLWLNTVKSVRDAEAKGGWKNYGGDKVWPSQQAAWPILMGRGWPPDEVVDGGPWELLDSTDRAIVIQSGASPHLRVRVEREIELARDGPRVTIVNTLTRLEASPFPVHVWSITQCRHPEFCLLGVSPRRPEKDRRWTLFSEKRAPVEAALTELGEDAILYRQPTDKASKIGTLGTWIAAVYEEDILVERAPFEPDGCYPDGASMELYADGNYIELEPLGPQLHLLAGESTTHTVTWELVKRPPGATPEELAEALSRPAEPR